MSEKARVYIAGPLGFSEAGRHFLGSVLVPFVAGLGYEPVDPWALSGPAEFEEARHQPDGPARREAWRALNRRIGARNRGAIDGARAVIAVLDGPDVDSGTAAEIGYAFARGKLVVGYRSDLRLAAENEGGVVNLQVEYFIRESGGDIVSAYTDLARVLGSLADSTGGPA